MLHFDGIRWDTTELGLSATMLDMWGFGPDDLWAVGGETWRDGTWTRHIAAGTENADLWGSGSDDVWIGGMFELAHWNGSEWLMLAEASHGVTAIWGFAEDDVWVADDSELFHFDGSTWETTELVHYSG